LKVSFQLMRRQWLWWCSLLGSCDNISRPTTYLLDTLLRGYT